MLGRALLRMEREFDKHVAYCRDEPRAQHLLATDPVVSKYFQVSASHEIKKKKGFCIISFLIQASLRPVLFVDYFQPYYILMGSKFKIEIIKD